MSYGYNEEYFRNKKQAWGYDPRDLADLTRTEFCGGPSCFWMKQEGDSRNQPSDQTGNDSELAQPQEEVGSQQPAAQNALKRQ